MKCAAAVSIALLLVSTALTGQDPNQYQTAIQKSSDQILVQQSITAPDGSTVWTTRTLTPAEAQKAGIRIPPLVNSCPVSLRARQAAAAFTRQVNHGRPRDNGVPPRDIAQRLHLSVTSQGAKRVLAANITVRGFADKGRLVEALSTQDNPDAAKTLEAHFATGTAHENSTDLWIPGLSAVSSIDLNSITYDDGSTWKLAAGSSCRVPIDGVMLIGNR